MSGEWTPTKISALIALWNEGLSTSEIGHRLGITKNAVVGKVHRLGLPKRHTSSARKGAETTEPTTIIRLEGLKAGMCSWPEGEPGTEGFRFCGAPALEGRPYCQAHCERAYVQPSKDKKEKPAAA